MQVIHIRSRRYVHLGYISSCRERERARGGSCLSIVKPSRGAAESSRGRVVCGCVDIPLDAVLVMCWGFELLSVSTEASCAKASVSGYICGC